MGGLRENEGERWARNRFFFLSLSLSLSSFDLSFLFFFLSAFCLLFAPDSVSPPFFSSLSHHLCNSSCEKFWRRTFLKKTTREKNGGKKRV